MNLNAALTTTLGFRSDLKTREILPTGLPSLDAVIEGFPRGAISEIIGPDSSGTNYTNSFTSSCIYIKMRDLRLRRHR